jgi:hypothetical protein
MALVFITAAQWVKRIMNAIETLQLVISIVVFIAVIGRVA